MSLHKNSLNWGAVAVLAALLACVLAQIPDQKVVKTRVKTRTVTVEKTVVKERTVKVGTKPDGYMTADECYKAPEGMSVSDVVYRWGWPAGQDEDDYSVGWFTYPLREDHERACQLDIWRGKIEHKTLDSDNGTTLTMGN